MTKGMAEQGASFEALRVEIANSMSSEGVKKFFAIALEPRLKRKPGRFRQIEIAKHMQRKPESLGHYRMIGTGAILGRAADACFEETVQRGVPVKAIDALVDHKVLTMGEVATHILPRRTLDHRKRSKKPLTMQESERALRLARIVAMAEDTFANPEKAAIWLRRPNRTMDERTPLDMADTEPGGRIVEDALQRIAHGIAA